MTHSEFSQIDRFIRIYALAARLYISLASVLLVFALFVIGHAVLHPPIDLNEKMISAITGLFGAIPLPLAGRAYSAFLGWLSLKDDWVEAKRVNDEDKIRDTKLRFQNLRDKAIEKGMS